MGKWDFFKKWGGSPPDADRIPAGAKPEDAFRLQVLRSGAAKRVVFFYPGEEGTYIDNAEVTLYENGIVHIQSRLEETTTSISNCEILWYFSPENASTDASEKSGQNIRLLKHPQNQKSSKSPHPPSPHK